MCTNNKDIEANVIFQIEKLLCNIILSTLEASENRGRTLYSVYDSHPLLENSSYLR